MTQANQTRLWQDFAGGYDDLMQGDPNMNVLSQVIVSALPIDPHNVLDLGTGTGNLLKRIRSRHPDCALVGLDPEPEMLEKARRSFPGDAAVDFLEGSAHLIEAPDGVFDAVVANYALHHLDHDQKELCAAEVYRVLKPGGRFILGDQHCSMMGDGGDEAWVAQMYEILCAKGLYYLKHAGVERMMLLVRMMPKYLLGKEKLPATVPWWKECLQGVGFTGILDQSIGPAEIFNSVIIAEKGEML